MDSSSELTVAGSPLWTLTAIVIAVPVSCAGTDAPRDPVLGTFTAVARSQSSKRPSAATPTLLADRSRCSIW